MLKYSTGKYKSQQLFNMKSTLPKSLITTFLFLFLSSAIILDPQPFEKNIVKNSNSQKQNPTQENSEDDVSYLRRNLQLFDPSQIQTPTLVVINTGSNTLDGVDQSFRGLVYSSSSQLPSRPSVQATIQNNNVRQNNLDSTLRNSEKSDISGNVQTQEQRIFDPNNIPSVPPPTVVNTNTNIVIDGVQEAFPGIVNNNQQKSSSTKTEQTTPIQANESNQINGQLINNQKPSQSFSKPSIYIPEPQQQCLPSILPIPSEIQPISFSSEFDLEVKKRIQSMGVVKSREQLKNEDLEKAQAYTNRYTSQEILKYKQNIDQRAQQVYFNYGQSNYIAVPDGQFLKIYRFQGVKINKIVQRSLTDWNIADIKASGNLLFLVFQDIYEDTFTTAFIVYKFDGSDIQMISVLFRNGHYIGMHLKNEGKLTIIIETDMLKYERKYTVVGSGSENMVENFYFCSSCVSLGSLARDYIQVQYQPKHDDISYGQISYHISSYFFCPKISSVSVNQQSPICISSLTQYGLTLVDCLHQQQNRVMQHWRIQGNIINTYNFGYVWDSQISQWVFHSQSFMEGQKGNITLQISNPTRGLSTFTYYNYSPPTYVGQFEGDIAVVQKQKITLLDLSSLNIEEYTNSEGLMVLSGRLGLGRSKDNKNVKISIFSKSQDFRSNSYEINAISSSTDYHARIINLSIVDNKVFFPIKAQITSDSPQIEGFVYMELMENKGLFQFYQYPFRSPNQSLILYTHSNQQNIKDIRLTNDKSPLLISVSGNQIQARNTDFIQAFSRIPINQPVPNYLSRFIGSKQL